MEAKQARSPRVATGVAGLDAILNGGLPRDRLYLVQGDPGVGKTTLALQFLLEGKRVGESGLYVTLGETREELIAVARSHSWDLEGIDVFEISTGVSDEDLRSEDESYDVFHPSEIELGEVMRTLIAEAERVKPMRVVIDSLSELRLLARDPLRFRRQMLQLKHFFVGRGATVLLLDAMSEKKIGELQSNTLVHGVILLEQTVPPFGSKRRRLNVTKLRGIKFDDGYHDFKIETGGLRVFPRLVAASHSNGKHNQACSSGLPELDQLLGGGLARGASTIIVGPAGSGKSTIASQFVAAAADRGENSAVYAFDESVATFVERSDGVGLKMSEKVAAGLVKPVRVDPGELAPFEFAQMVRHAVEVDDAKIIVIDSLNGYMNATPDERFLVVQLHELLTFLGNKGVCTIIVVAQAGMLGPSMASPIDASYLADVVLMMRYFEHGGRILKSISVVKKRTGTHENTLREFGISDGKIRVGEPLTKFRGVLTGVPEYDGDESPLFGGSDDGGRA
jgi:circadian clock protein KaiC